MVRMSLKDVLRAKKSGFKEGQVEVKVWEVKDTIRLPDSFARLSKNPQVILSQGGSIINNSLKSSKQEREIPKNTRNEGSNYL